MSQLDLFVQLLTGLGAFTTVLYEEGARLAAGIIWLAVGLILVGGIVLILVVIDIIRNTITIITRLVRKKRSEIDTEGQGSDPNAF